LGRSRAVPGFGELSEQCLSAASCCSRAKGQVAREPEGQGWGTTSLSRIPALRDASTSLYLSFGYFSLVQRKVTRGSRVAAREKSLQRNHKLHEKIKKGTRLSCEAAGEKSLNRIYNKLKIYKEKLSHNLILLLLILFFCSAN